MKASESEDEESVTGPRAVFCAYEREDDECHAKCKEDSHSLSILLRCSYLSPSPRERALKFSAADQQFASISFKNRSITLTLSVPVSFGRGLACIQSPFFSLCDLGGVVGIDWLGLALADDLCLLVTVGAPAVEGRSKDGSGGVVSCLFLCLSLKFLYC